MSCSCLRQLRHNFLRERERQASARETAYNLIYLTHARPKHVVHATSRLLCLVKLLAHSQFWESQWHVSEIYEHYLMCTLEL